MVDIPDNYLILFLGGIFIPLFVFLVKMIIEQGRNAARLDVFDEHLKETKGHHTTIELIRQRLEQLENDVKYLFQIAKNFRNQRDNRDIRDRDRDGTYYPDGDIDQHGG